MRESFLLHLHPDFQRPLEDLLDVWNSAQESCNFVGLRPRREAERVLLTPGSISNDQASQLAADIRISAGHLSANGIMVFTEKRLYDPPMYYQLFVGGRSATEVPPRIAVLSLEFLRKSYRGHQTVPILFRAITCNILFSVGIDCGLQDHRETVGCIMDFCSNMSDIEIGIRNGLRLCAPCSRSLESNSCRHLLQIVDATMRQPDIVSVDQSVTESIVMRGERYKVDRDFNYDVALSFAGDDRRYADELAMALRSIGLAVFYDQFDEASLWGKDLHSYLTELYRLRARYCVIFLSSNYKRNKWTRLELNAALAREFEAGEEYILPIRLDESQIEGILPTRGYVDWKSHSVEEVTELVRRKLDAQNE